MHPKVYVPLGVNIFIGTLLLIVGVATHDDVTKNIGIGVLTAAAAQGGVGYATPGKKG